MKNYGRIEGKGTKHRTLADWEGPALPAGWNSWTPEQQDAWQERMFEAEHGRGARPAASSAVRDGRGGGVRGPRPSPSAGELARLLPPPRKASKPARAKSQTDDWWETWDAGEASGQGEGDWFETWDAPPVVQRIDLAIQKLEQLGAEAASARRAQEDMSAALARLEREIRLAW